MNIELIRTNKSKESIDGILLVNGTKICDTAENAITALPAGNYRIARHFCKQYNRFVPLIVENQASGSRAEEDAKCKVLSVKPDAPAHCTSCRKRRMVTNNTCLPHRCPQFCPGNGIHNRTDGVIILGTLIVPGCMKSPREPYENLMERIRKSIDRGHDITLTIVETFRKPSASCAYQI